MRYITHLYCLIFCLGLYSCSTADKCKSSFSELIEEKIMSVKYYDNEYRRRELERKEQIMSVFCKDLKGKEKILIIEVLGDKVYGLLHIYDNESTFTYQQNSEKIVTSHGFRYDRYGNLKATFLSLDSNVIESIERKIQGNKSRPKVDDALPVQFFYIDFNKNSNYYFYLY